MLELGNGSDNCEIMTTREKIKYEPDEFSDAERVLTKSQNWNQVGILIIIHNFNESDKPHIHISNLTLSPKMNKEAESQNETEIMIQFKINELSEPRMSN